MTGSYILSQDTMRVDNRLIDVSTAEVALAETTDGSAKDFLQIERKLATKLLEALTGTLPLIYQKKIGVKGTKSLDALQAFLKGFDAMDDGDKERVAKELLKVLALEVTKTLQALYTAKALHGSGYSDLLKK